MSEGQHSVEGLMAERQQIQDRTRLNHAVAGWFMDSLLARGLVPGHVRQVLAEDRDGPLAGEVVNAIARIVGRRRGMSDEEITDAVRCVNMGLPRGIALRLENAGIFTLGDLRKKTPRQLLAIEWIGPGRLRHIHDALVRFGVPPEWDPPD